MRNKVWHVKLFIIPLLLILALSAAVAPQEALADGPHGFVIVTNYADLTIYTIDTSTDTVHGPFLGGQLGTSGSLLDVALTHDGRTALIANWDELKVYFVDVSNPISPVLLGHVDLTTIPLPPEDIAITHDDKFAVVTDGTPSTSVVSIDINSRSVADNQTATEAEAVDVAPDGTVIVVGNGSNTVETFTIDNAGVLTFGASYTDGLDNPINVSIAPDGQTVIVCNGTDDTVAVYRITSPGTLEYKGTVSGLPGLQQSVAFNHNGSKAYVLSLDPSPDQLSVLNITGPGAVSIEAAPAATLFGDHIGWFGVDAITVVGNTAYVGANPGKSEVVLVDLTTYAVSNLTGFGNYPNGVDSFVYPVWSPDDCYKMHYPQLPDLTENGIDVAANWNDYARPADDFLCTESGLITDIHLWGSYLYNEDPRLHDLTFKLCIWSNNTTGPYNKPGEFLWSGTFEEGSYVENIYATEVPETYRHPSTIDTINSTDNVVWQYDFYIDPDKACEQTEGETYWLGVFEKGDTDLCFGWKTSTDNWNAATVWANDMCLNNPDWMQVTTGGSAPVSLDMAFVITTDTDYGTIIVEKQTDPDGSAQEFEFIGDAAGTIKDDEQIVRNCLTPGTYTSQEIVPGGWALVDITVDDDSSATPSEVNVDGASVTFNVDPGETVKATFKDQKITSPPPTSEPTTGGETVGITVMPMDKAGLLLPWLGLAGLVIVITGTWVFARRRINR
jgi:DNA-binding beta-propeller fold protein YncE